MKTTGKSRDIDELFREGMDNFVIEPSPTVKASLMRRVGAREFLRFNPARFNLYYLAAAAATAGAIVFLTLGGTGTPVNGEKVLAPADTTTHTTGSVKSETTSEIAGRSIVTESVKSEKEVTSTADMGATKERAVPVESPDIKSAEKGSGSDVNILSVKPPDRLQPAEQTISPATPVSSFVMSLNSGCAPLAVSLISTSRNAESLTWVSDDGRHAEGEKVDWIFTKPGTYRVSLNVTGAGGRKDNSSAVIVVHPSPKAGFDVSPAGSGLSDRDILLFNYSENFLTAIWDFGDGVTSMLNDPVHTYRNAGTYKIVLKVASEYGCVDTISKIYNTSRGVYTIEFPNAFIPNKNGPTGGYYSLRSDEAANVFHPVYEGVTEYHLAVYSRTGVMLFESRSINVGWDGYYKGQLCEPGVYVWRARGRYANGEAFQKSGDVTLLRF